MTDSELGGICIVNFATAVFEYTSNLSMQMNFFLNKILFRRFLLQNFC